MTLVPAIILGPIAAGAGLLWLKPETSRKVLVGAATVAIGCCVLFLAQAPAPAGTAGYPLNHHWLERAMTAAEAAMALYIIYVGLRARNALIVALMLTQAAVLVWLEAAHGPRLTATHNLFVDKLTIVMALINGLIGGGICVYALGYMRHYHEVAHREVADRRPFFFGSLFVFMGAMFGLIFSNNLLWLFFFWEVTTCCSFLLIGYSQTEAARRNALRALVMNLAGGLAFAVAIVWCYRTTGRIELQELLRSGPQAALVPAALLCFAGITKSAQLPFSSWLLGAMVAPTPVSALLHSSTMVKAGVYLVLRMAPIVAGTKVGLMVALVGSVTFLVGSLAAIGANDAKRVLAWSTIANLGLVVLCGGIGTAAAIWAGVLLIIFHALAKCLLFLCVGAVEHQLHSRDIEAMSGLIVRSPRLAIMMLIGMAGMFLAPFGMLISKWAVLQAVVDAYPALSVFIAFGSAGTLFFWVKWMGKLLEVVALPEPLPSGLAPGQWVALYSLSASTLLACLLFPCISSLLIEPYVAGVYGRCASMAPGNLVIMTIMMLMVLLFPLSFLHYGRGVKVMDAYLGGANLNSSVRFLGAAGKPQEVALGNYYLKGLFDEAKLSRWGQWSCGCLLVAMLAASLAATQFPAERAGINPGLQAASYRSSPSAPADRGQTAAAVPTAESTSRKAP